MAVDIAFNAKPTSSPYVCNAQDTLIVHSGIASEFLPKVAGEAGRLGVWSLRCDRRARSIIGNSNGVTIASATDEDWGTEFLALTAAIKVVDSSFDEALDHIEQARAQGTPT